MGAANCCTTSPNDDLRMAVRQDVLDLPAACVLHSSLERHRSSTDDFRPDARRDGPGSPAAIGLKRFRDCGNGVVVADYVRTSNAGAASPLDTFAHEHEQRCAEVPSPPRAAAGLKTLLESMGACTVSDKCSRGMRGLPGAPSLKGFLDGTSLSSCSARCCTCADDLSSRVRTQLPGLPLAPCSKGFLDTVGLPSNALALEPVRPCPFYRDVPGERSFRAPVRPDARPAAAMRPLDVSDVPAERPARAAASRAAAPVLVDRGVGEDVAEVPADSTESFDGCVLYPPLPAIDCDSWGRGMLAVEAPRIVAQQRRWGKPATSRGLSIGFLLPDGSEKIIDFANLGPPLGIAFEPKAPCRILEVRPGTHCHRLGVEVGWTIKYVNEHRVDTANADHVVEIMQSILISR
mmetsp:Transcript_33397/g.85109  ORF Transcript_33397/g.85109 Transcript_33397/m.85109 type:complete len:405 (+) Transcript_33397:55-1269(+)